MSYLERESGEKAYPSVSYSLSLAKSPYEYDFDLDAYSDFLTENGMSDDQINQLSVNLEPSILPLAGGLYSLKKNSILINTSVSSKMAGIYFRSRARKEFKEENPREPDAYSTFMNATLLHETKHAMSDRKTMKKFGKAKTWVSQATGAVVTTGLAMKMDIEFDIPAVTKGLSLVGVAIATTLATSLLIYFSPLDVPEHQARRFSKKHSKDPRWNKILRVKERKA